MMTGGAARIRFAIVTSAVFTIVMAGCARYTITSFPSEAPPNTNVNSAEIGGRQGLGPATLSFQQNVGQAPPDVRFLARARGRTIALTGREAILGPGGTTARSLRLRFLGANDVAEISATAEALDPLFMSPAHANGAATRIPQFRRINYTDLYPGVNLTYYGNDRQLEFDVVVAPHADPSIVRFLLDGVDAVEILDNGDLSARVDGESIRLLQPVVYQERDGLRSTINARYVLHDTTDRREVGFDLGTYDDSLPLVIDPVILHSNGNDTIVGMEVNFFGQTYVLAETTNPAGLEAQADGFAAFPPPYCYLTKLNAAGTGTLYTLLFTNTINCSALTVSPFGSVHFAGYERPTVQNLHVATVLTINDLSAVPFVTRFAANNYNQLNQRIAAMEVDGAGNLYLLGACRVVDTLAHPPLQLNGFNTAPNAGTSNPAAVCTTTSAAAGAHADQTILTKFDRFGNFQYGSFLTPDDAGGTRGRWGLAAAGTGRVYLSGIDAGSLTPTANAFRDSCEGGGPCAYVMSIDTTRTGPGSLVYASALWRISQMGTQSLRVNGQSLYVAMDGLIDADFPETARHPYPAFRGFDPPAGDGIAIARFDLDVDFMPSQLAYALQSTPGRPTSGDAPVFQRIHTLNDLRVLPSGAVAISSVLTTNAAPASRVGYLDVFYKSGQLRASSRSYELSENATGDPPGFRIAADPNGTVVLAKTSTQIDTPAAWDIRIDSIPDLDPPGFGNTPPGMTVSGPMTANALSPAGAFVPFTVSGFDAEDDWVDPECSHSANTPFPVGVTTVTCTATDLGGLVTSTSFDVTVALLINIGPELTGIPIDLIDARTVAAQVNPFETIGKLTVTAIGAVDAPGTIYFETRTDQSPSAPPGLQSGSSPYYYDVGMTAPMSGANQDIEICIDFTGMSFAADVSTLRLYRLRNSIEWVDVTNRIDHAARRICAIAHSPSELGTFAMFTPADDVTRVTTIAGNGTYGSGPQNGDGGPAAAATFIQPAQVAFDLPRDVMYIADFYSVRAVRLSDGQITTYAGTGPYPLLGDIQDDVLATEAGLFHVTGVAVDADGNLFLAQPDNCVIRRVDFLTKRIRTVAGQWTGDQTTSCGYQGDGGAARDAQISLNSQIVFDSNGDLLLTQFMARPQDAFRRATVIRKIARSPLDGRIAGRPDEIITTIAGNGTFEPVPDVDPLSTGLYGAFALGNHNDLYAWAGVHQLVRVVFGGSTQLVAGRGRAPFSAPFAGDQLHPLHADISPSANALVVLPSGDVLFADGNSQKIRRISPGADGVVDGSADERITTVAGFTFPIESSLEHVAAEGYALSTAFPSTHGLTIDPRGGIVAVDSWMLRVRTFGVTIPVIDPNSADLAVTASGPTDPVNTDGDLRYDITVRNNGPATATGVALSYAIPAGAIFVSASHPSGVQCDTPAIGDAGTVICDVGPLAGGESRDVAITVRPHTAGPLSSVFTVSGAEPDGSPGNNSTTVTTTVNAGPTILDIAERIVVLDTVTPTPSTLLDVRENIVIVDTPTVVPSTLIDVKEHIVVVDTPGLVPSTRLDISERVVVIDTIGLPPPPAVISIRENISVGDSPRLLPAAMVAIRESVGVNDTPRLLGAALVDIRESIGVNDRPSVLPVEEPADGTIGSGGGTVQDDAFGARAQITLPAGLVNQTTAVTIDVLDSPPSTPLPSGIQGIGTKFVSISFEPVPTMPFAPPGATMVLPLLDPLPAGAPLLLFRIDPATDMLVAAVSVFGGPVVGTVNLDRSRATFRGVSQFSTVVGLIVGTPSIAATITGKSTPTVGTRTVQVTLTNRGTGHARNVRIGSIQFKTLSGSGTVTLLSPAVPIAVGNIDAGSSSPITLTLNVPATVQRFSIVENGAFENVAGRRFTFSLAQSVIP